MGMPEIKPSRCPISRHQAINDLLESIALGEAALAHIMNAEGEKIQAAVETADIHKIKRINTSVNQTLRIVSKIEMLLQYKLEAVNEMRHFYHTCK